MCAYECVCESVWSCVHVSMCMRVCMCICVCRSQNRIVRMKEEIGGWEGTCDGIKVRGEQNCQSNLGKEGHPQLNRRAWRGTGGMYNVCMLHAHAWRETATWNPLPSCDNLRICHKSHLWFKSNKEKVVTLTVLHLALIKIITYFEFTVIKPRSWEWASCAPPWELAVEKGEGV